jgi:hypothetical protein
MPCEELTLDLNMAKSWLGNRAVLDAVPALAALERRYTAAVAKYQGQCGCKGAPHFDLCGQAAKALQGATQSQKAALLSVLGASRIVGHPSSSPKKALLA